MAQSQFRMLACATAGVHAVAAQSRHSFARHTHEQFGIGTIQLGAQRWRSDKRQVEAGLGQVIAVNPGEVHDGEPIGDVGRSWRMLYFDPSVLQAAAAEIFPEPNREFELAQPVVGDSRLVKLVDELFFAETSLHSEPLRREELILSLVAGIGRPRTCRTFTRPASIALAISRMNDDLAGQHSLAELAEISQMSRLQFLRSFARETGMPPHAYLVQQRVDFVRRLLASGTALAEAALEAGFADQSHMTRAFVRRYGVTPGAYAKVAKSA